MLNPLSNVTRPPLVGVKVLDLTRLLPGPVCGLHLADLGADVIKIEDTDAGDYAAKPLRDLVNRNKRSVRLNLKTAQGLNALLRLCDDADVLIEGFRPGVMDRLGVGYAAVKQRNPSIVYCSLSGYGQTGSLREQPGHDLNYCSLTGVADQVGNQGQPPALSNLPMADLLGGSMVAVMGILSALFDIGRGGMGRHIDIAIADGILAHAVLPLASVNTQGEAPATGQAKLTGALPWYSVYSTKDGRHLAVAALERKFWLRFCDIIQRPDLAQVHSDQDSSRHDWVRSQLAELIAQRDLVWWQAKLENSQCCVTPMLRLEEVLDDPHFVERNMIMPLHSQDAGDENAKNARQFGCPVQMTDFTFEVRMPAPVPGEHTDEVLQQVGFSLEELTLMRSSGATA